MTNGAQRIEAAQMVVVAPGPAIKGIVNGNTLVSSVWRPPARRQAWFAFRGARSPYSRRQVISDLRRREADAQRIKKTLTSSAEARKDDEGRLAWWILLARGSRLVIAANRTAIPVDQ
jgi:hypothetical protein